MKIEALTDSYSIFSYLAAAHLKLPAEKGTYYHLAYLREKLVSRLIGSYTWVDTRDMVADGLTKGRADRTALIAMMHGKFILDHPSHEYLEPSPTTTGDGHHLQQTRVVASSLRLSVATDGYDNVYTETEKYQVPYQYTYYDSGVYNSRCPGETSGDSVATRAVRLQRVQLLG